MSTAVGTRPAEGVLRATWDPLLTTLALAQGALLLAVPVLPVIALGLWWNSNTVSHYALHRPVFRCRPLNLMFSLYLSLLLGVPQCYWRGRHLAHHAGVPHRLRWGPQLVVQTAGVVLLWGSLAFCAPAWFLTAYVPGYALGLALCWVHGHYEHVRGTVSHHGWVYNWLFLNDGYHVEHHAHPGEHWTRLPLHVDPTIPASRWPAVLRWLDNCSLDGLERLVLRSRWLQQFVCSKHERAFRRLLPHLTDVRRVAIVGGGLFPRTLRVLQKLLPGASFTLIDCSRENLDVASPFLAGDVEIRHAWYAREAVADFDLVVFPLAFRGDREGLYARPPARIVVIHDWLWRCRGCGTVVSLLLLKRLNLVMA
jgi:hypothetical protein